MYTISDCSPPVVLETSFLMSCWSLAAQTVRGLWQVRGGSCEVTRHGTCLWVGYTRQYVRSMLKNLWCSSCWVFSLCSGQNGWNVAQGRNNGNQVTGSREAKMPEINGYRASVWKIEASYTELSCRKDHKHNVVQALLIFIHHTLHLRTSSTSWY